MTINGKCYNTVKDSTNKVFVPMGNTKIGFCYRFPVSPSWPLLPHPACLPALLFSKSKYQ